MTATTYDLPAAPRQQGRVALLWMSVFTAAWTVVLYWQPAIQASGVPTAASRIFVHALIALGLWLGLERTEMIAAQRRNAWLAVMVPFTLWVSVVWSAAINGLFKPGAIGLPLTPMAIFLPVIIGAPIVLRSKRLGQVLDAMPATWLVALQCYRVFGALFLANWARGAMPGIFALPAGAGDVVTGLFALPAAIALASGSASGRRAAVMWNIFGLVDFAVAVSIGIITSPGPLQLIVPSVPNGTGLYPTVLVPTLAVPSSILLHVVSLRQLWRRAKA